jgi:hypothetical protein
MDESPDHEPTLIARGMGIHLNHLITTRRGICNPSHEGTPRERSKQVGELAPITSNGPRLGGSTHGYTS